MKLHTALMRLPLPNLGMSFRKSRIIQIKTAVLHLNMYRLLREATNNAQLKTHFLLGADCATGMCVRLIGFSSISMHAIVSGLDLIV